MTTVLITGSNRGIGKALVQEALLRGYRVIAGMREVDTSVFAPDAARLHLVALDVSDDASVKAASLAINEPIDILINNAGVSGTTTSAVATTDFADMLNTLNVNTVGPMRVSHAFLPHVKSGLLKKIITITSGMAEMNDQSNWMSYRVSKVAANKATRALATDLKPEGIAVAMLCPGWVRTAMGGPSATTSPQDSAEGLFRVIDDLNLANTGFYKNFSGKTLPF